MKRRFGRPRPAQRNGCASARASWSTVPEMTGDGPGERALLCPGVMPPRRHAAEEPHPPGGGQLGGSAPGKPGGPATGQGGLCTQAYRFQAGASRLYRLRVARYAAAGLAVSLGAPGGYLALRALIAPAELTLARELREQLPLYLYLLLATAVAFAAFGAVIGTLTDRLVQANDRLAALATTDALTGLKNARAFHERLGAELARAERSGTPLGLVLLDLDHLKEINDRLGHAAGNQALAQVGRQLARSVRRADTACRVGGDELAVICPEADSEELHRIAERIRTLLAQVPLAGEPLTVSVGTALHRPGGTSDQLFIAADGALYQAKRGGRNRVVSARDSRDSEPGKPPAPGEEESGPAGC